MSQSYYFSTDRTSRTLALSLTLFICQGMWSPQPLFFKKQQQHFMARSIVEQNTKNKNLLGNYSQGLKPAGRTKMPKNVLFAPNYSYQRWTFKRWKMFFWYFLQQYQGSEIFLPVYTLHISSLYRFSFIRLSRIVRQCPAMSDSVVSCF